MLTEDGTATILSSGPCCQRFGNESTEQVYRKVYGKNKRSAVWYVSQMALNTRCEQHTRMQLASNNGTQMWHTPFSCKVL